MTTLLALGALAATAQNVIPTTATITGATVYSQGVKLQLQGQVNAKAGYNKIVVADIPDGIQNENAIRANLTKGTTLLSVQYRQRTDEDPTNAKYAEIEKQISEIHNSIAKIKIKIAVVNKQMQVLDLYTKQNTETAVSADYLAQASELMGAKFNTYLLSKSELEQQITTYEVKIKELAKALLLNSSSDGIVEIDIESPNGGPTNFKIELISSQASWSPMYDIRIENGQAAIVTKAQLSQNTGIDWNNVKLNFTSSDIAQNSAALPYLHPITVGSQFASNAYQDEQTYFDISETKASVAAVMPAPTMVYEEELYDQRPVDMATVDQNANIVSYQTTTPYSIADNSNNIAVKLNEIQVPCSLQYLIVSSLTDKAYLTANINQATQLNLFNTKANIYFDGEFIGEQRIANSRIKYNKDILTLSLGEDKGVSFIKTVENFDNGAKFLSKNNAHSFGRKVDVTNNKTQSVNVKLLEQYPISVSSKSVVQELKFSSGGKAEETSGIVTWEFTLEPKSTKNISISYQVKEKE